MRLALFKYFPKSEPVVKPEPDAAFTTAVRVSEWVEVEFPALDPAPGEETWAKIAEVDKAIQAKRRAHEADIAALDEKRREAAAGTQEMAPLRVV